MLLNKQSLESKNSYPLKYKLQQYWILHGKQQKVNLSGKSNNFFISSTAGYLSSAACFGNGSQLIIFYVTSFFSFKNPELCIVARLFRPGDDLEVLCLREICVEEPTAAGLPKGKSLTATDDIEMPQLCVVLLSRAGDHAEVETRDLVCVQEASTGDLLKATQVSLLPRHNPALCVVLLSRAGDHAEVETRDLVCVQEASTGLLYDSDDSL